MTPTAAIGGYPSDNFQNEKSSLLFENNNDLPLKRNIIATNSNIHEEFKENSAQRYFLFDMHS